MRQSTGPRPSPAVAAAVALLLSAGGLAAQRAPARPGAVSARPPNIVFILADDAGYGDIGAYGQRRFATPNIDRLAAEGMRFTQFYAGSTVCAPSRSVLMTGEHTGHTFIRGNAGSLAREKRTWKGDTPLPDSVVTLQEVLKGAGYVTGVFGKWGLGYPGSEGAPGRQGVDDFFGYLSHVAAHFYYPEHLWENDHQVTLAANANAGMRTYSHDVIHARALAFLDRNRDRPFFLYLPYTIPHAEILPPRDSILERFEKLYHEDPLPQAANNRAHYGKGYAIPERPRAARAAAITRLDRSVGDILRKLRELGLEENTIVIFSSDNGPTPEGKADLDFFDSNGPLRGGKRDLYEGGIREPMLVRWPGKVAPGSVSDHVGAFWDVLPTLAEIAGAQAPAGIDGISFLPTLLGRGKQAEHPYLYWEFYERGGKQAVRRGKWKAVWLDVIAHPGRPAELYDLSTDLAEEHDLAASHPEIVRELDSIRKAAHRPSTLFTGIDQPAAAP